MYSNNHTNQKHPHLSSHRPYLKSDVYSKSGYQQKMNMNPFTDINLTLQDNPNFQKVEEQKVFKQKKQVKCQFNTNPESKNLAQTNDNDDFIEWLISDIKQRLKKNEMRVEQNIIKYASQLGRNSSDISNWVKSVQLVMKIQQRVKEYRRRDLVQREQYKNQVRRQLMKLQFDNQYIFCEVAHRICGILKINEPDLTDWIKSLSKHYFDIKYEKMEIKRYGEKIKNQNQSSQQINIWKEECLDIKSGEQSLVQYPKNKKQIIHSKIMKKQQNQSIKIFPMPFKQNIANKIDEILKNVINQILKVKSEELCLPYSTIQTIYRQYGTLIPPKYNQQIINKQQSKQIADTHKVQEKNTRKNIQAFGKQKQSNGEKVWQIFNKKPKNRQKIGAVRRMKQKKFDGPLVLSLNKKLKRININKIQSSQQLYNRFQKQIYQYIQSQTFLAIAQQKNLSYGLIINRLENKFNQIISACHNKHYVKDFIKNRFTGDFIYNNNISQPIISLAPYPNKQNIGNKRIRKYKFNQNGEITS